MAAEDWDRLIKKREESCSECEKTFEEGDTVVTALLMNEEGFERKELCQACVDALEDEPFSTWKTQLHKSEERAGPRRLDLSYLSDLFRRLQGKDDDMARRLSWISALLLLRKKVLELRGRKDGAEKEVLLVGFRKEEEVFEISDPELDEETIAAISEDLGKVFNLDQKSGGKKGAKAKGKAAESGEAQQAGEDSEAPASPAD